jgi:hypothetical protein
MRRNVTVVVAPFKFARQSQFAGLPTTHRRPPGPLSRTPIRVYNRPGAARPGRVAPSRPGSTASHHHVPASDPARDLHVGLLALQTGLEGPRGTERVRSLSSAPCHPAPGLLGGLLAPDGDDWFTTACCHAALAGLAGRDGSGVSSGEASSGADTATALLATAVTTGYRNPDAFRTESALDPLRNGPDFRVLMMELVFPTEPFAP